MTPGWSTRYIPFWTVLRCSSWSTSYRSSALERSTLHKTSTFLPSSVMQACPLAVLHPNFQAFLKTLWRLQVFEAGKLEDQSQQRRARLRLWHFNTETVLVAIGEEANLLVMATVTKIKNAFLSSSSFIKSFQNLDIKFSQNSIGKHSDSSGSGPLKVL